MMENNISYKIEGFEGPLDLLLQLIAKNKLNIYDIPLTTLVDQYLEQIELFKAEEMEIESEFLEMAARLLYIKTVSLLPKHEEIVKLKEELTGELLEYMVCQQVARQLSEMQDGFNRFVRLPNEPEPDKTYELIHQKDVMYLSYLSAVGRGKRKLPPSTAPFTKIVAKKIVAVSTKIVFVIRNLWTGGSKKLGSLYKTAHSRSELVATFLAVLELCKANRIRVDGESDDAQITLIKEHKRK
ncbi:MAG: segregation/condensation protein A [Acutalibacteraceae bacterium]|nr:segregation/condensation protein A [Acutalibacteraceae bacterium]